MKPNAVHDDHHRVLNQAVASTNNPNVVNVEHLRYPDEEFGTGDRKASSTTGKGNRTAAPAGKTAMFKSTSTKRKRNTAVRNTEDEDEDEAEEDEEDDPQPRKKKRTAPSGNPWSNGKSRGEFAMINIDSKDLEAGGGRLVGRRGQLARVKAGEIGYGGDPNPGQNNFGYLPLRTESKSTARKRAAQAPSRGSAAKRAKVNPKGVQSRGGGKSADGDDDDDDDRGERPSVPKPELRVPCLKPTLSTRTNQPHNQYIASFNATSQKYSTLADQVAAKVRQVARERAEKYSREARERAERYSWEARERAIEADRAQEIVYKRQLRMMAKMLGRPVPPPSRPIPPLPSLPVPGGFGKTQPRSYRSALDSLSFPEVDMWGQEMRYGNATYGNFSNAAFGRVGYVEELVSSPVDSVQDGQGGKGECRGSEDELVEDGGTS